MEERTKDCESRMKKKTCGKVDVPTEEEIAALRAMRRIKERVRDVRNRLSAAPADSDAERGGERAALEEEMEKLKGEWKDWEKARKKAAHDRMVLLGHEKPAFPEHDETPPS